MIECTFEDCDRPKRARGLCNGHYLQQWSGKELTPLLHTLPPECSFPDCGRPKKSLGMCEGHYYQRRRGVELKPLSARAKDPKPCVTKRYDIKFCVMDGCDTVVQAKGLCGKHLLRKYKHGDPSIVGNLWGPSNGRWKEVPSYQRAHTRIRRRRGPARRYSCVGCGASAAEWAYDHKCHNELWQDGRPYSTDIDRYQPMCKSCHKLFDISKALA